MKLNSFLILLSFILVIANGQTPKNDFPRDTSFSVQSTGENIKKKFPNASVGGGWASGNKSHLVPLSQKLAENGFFSATVEHHLSPEGSVTQ